MSESYQRPLKDMPKEVADDIVEFHRERGDELSWIIVEYTGINVLRLLIESVEEPLNAPPVNERFWIDDHPVWLEEPAQFLDGELYYDLFYYPE